MDIDASLTYGMSGRISSDPTVVMPGTTFKSPVDDPSCPDLEVCMSLATL